MKKKLFAIAMAAILLAPSALQAKVQHLLPKPQQITATENVAAFALGGTVTTTIRMVQRSATCWKSSSPPTAVPWRKAEEWP